MAEKDRKYSLARIAAELGVSKAAVSLAVNGKGRQAGLSEESERRILDFCTSINYRPNIHAQRMNRRLVRNIGLLLFQSPEIGAGNPFSEYNTAEIVGGVSQATEAAGYRFSVQLYRPGMEAGTVYDWFRSREIDGLIYYGFDLPPDWVETFRSEGRYTVGVGIDPEYGLPCVNIDNFAMAAQLTEVLLTRGAKKFFYLGGLPGSHVGCRRYDGFRLTLEKNGIVLPSGHFRYCHFNEEMARQAAVAIIDGGGIEPGTAVVCGNDAMAVGVHAVLRERGIGFPGPVMLTGADNIPLGRYLDPSLTTFNYLAFQQGENAFSLLHRMISGDPDCPTNIMLPSQLVLRGSA